MYSHCFDLIDVDDGFDFGHVDNVDSRFPLMDCSSDTPDAETFIPMNFPTEATVFPSDQAQIMTTSAPNATDMFGLGTVTTPCTAIAAAGPMGPVPFGTPMTPIAQPSPAVQPRSVQNQIIDISFPRFMATSQKLTQISTQLSYVNCAFGLRDNPISAVELTRHLIPPIPAAHHGRSLHRLRNGHGKNEPRDDPKEFYCRLPGPPPSWARGRSVFHYTSEGELDILFKFSDEAFLDYLVQPELVLLIQRSPTMHMHRYPNHSLSAKCRFRKCRAMNHTISRGELRVALSEHPALYGSLLDPFHCAGYVHLCCLESKLGVHKMVELHEWRKLLVHTHALPLEDRDPMYIKGVADEAGPYRRYVKWFGLAKSWVNNTLHEPIEGDKTLTWYMTKGILEAQSPYRSKLREKRQLTHFAKHMGNPEEKTRLKCAARAAKAEKERSGEARGRIQAQQGSQDGSRRRSRSPVRETGRTVDYRLRDEPVLGHADADDDDENDEDYEHTRSALTLF